MSTRKISKKTEKRTVKTDKKLDIKSSNTNTTTDNKTSDDKKIKYPISDDTIDYLDSCVDRLNDTKNIGEKISLHSTLTDTIKNLEVEIDHMVEIVDNIDIEKNSDDTNFEGCDNTSIDDDIVNLEEIMQKLKVDDILQTKIMQLQRISDLIIKCRRKCNNGQIQMCKCN